MRTLSTDARKETLVKMITVAGNVGRDAELRSTQSGEKVLGFSVAVEERGGQEKRTLWFDCSVWGKRGEALERHIRKGDKITVAGEFSTREHDGKTYLTVRASEVTLQGGGQSAGSDRTGPGYSQRPTPPTGGGSYGDDALNDDVPY